MDSLNYNYYKGSNHLAQVLDAVPAGNYPNDIDNEPSKRNYRYNSNGQLAKDSAGGIDTIIWNIYGKVMMIRRATDSIVFEYDPLGNRLEKRDFTHHDSLIDTTLYSRDAQGNILAVYTRQKDTVKLNEWDLYGAKRIGTLDTNLRVYPYTGLIPPPPLDSVTVAYLEGQKRYELTNHLGNVLATVSDRKWAIDTTGTPGIANYYEPNIINAEDYYPFGMIEPGRSYQILHDSSYRFGFNGKLHDDNIYGNENSYDYGMRMYNPRLGKFLSIDPIFKKYPELSPYQFASNSPIMAKDLDGKEMDIDATVRAAQESAQAGDNSTFDFMLRYTKNVVLNATGINGLLDLAKEGSDGIKGSMQTYTNSNNSQGYNKYTPDNIKSGNEVKKNTDALKKGTEGMVKVAVASALFVALAIPGDAEVYGIAEQGGKEFIAVIDKGIAKDMAKRGWTDDIVANTIKNPYTSRESTDQVGNAATAFYNKDGSYVVVTNSSKKVVQVSKIGDKGWIPDRRIKNPYIPPSEKK